MKSKKYKKIIIGVDQSYTRTGITIGADGKVLNIGSMNFKGLNSKSKKRKALRDKLYYLLEKATLESDSVTLICERIRTFSKNKGGEFNISTNYIKATGALIATIVDIGCEFDVKTYSVDTRAWKSRVIGSTKAIKGDKKLATIRYVEKLGYGEKISKVNKKGKIVYDDDAADSCGICLYGFLPKSIQKMKLEE